MNIEIETIPHKDHRYPTVGDWFYAHETADTPKLIIRVSDLGDWRREALVAVHELIECLICKHDGVTQEAVDAFDKQFEKDRAEGKHSETEEPGDSAEAPYRRQHGVASGVERILAAALDVNWNAYADQIESLP